jgi:hypothetical protein
MSKARQMVKLDQPVYRSPMSQSPHEPRPQPDKPLMRSIGEFFGHVVKGIKTDVDPANKTVTRQTVEEEVRDTPQGPVILRRTIIEEVQVPTKPARPEPPTQP